MLSAIQSFAALSYIAALGIALVAFRKAIRINNLSLFRQQQFSIDWLLLVLGVLLHAASLFFSTVFVTPNYFGFAHAFSAMLLIAACVYLFESLFTPIGAIRLVLMPVAAIAVSLPAIFPGAPLVPALQGAMFDTHLVLALLAYGLLAVASMHAASMAVIEFVLHTSHVKVHPLKNSWRSRLLDLSPPLLVMEQLLFRTLGLGFALLTLTLVTGIGFHEYVFGRSIRFDHKTVFSILSWCMFAVLLLGRWRYGWRGRTALRYVLLGFMLLLLSYIGTHFVLEVVLGRH